jgi:hypothetical protein
MNATMQRTQFEISNSCECAYCPACETGTEGAQCLDCQGVTTPLDYCDGGCWEYKLDWLDESVEEFASVIGNPYELRIQGRNMGWTRASGYTTCKANHKERFIRTGNSKRKSAREKDSSCDECVWSAVPESRAPKHDHGDESRHMPSGSNGGLQRGFGSE